MATELSLSKLQRDIHTALQAWYEAGSHTSSLNYLHLFQQARAGGANNARQAANQLLLEALETLAFKNRAETDLLRKRFLDGTTMHAVANQLNVGESTAYRKQQEALKQLALIVQEKELEARNSYQTALEKRLELPPVVELFGVESHLKQLQEILAAESIWLVSIEGLGGIGKTALANALVRQPGLAGRFYKVGWVSAKQQEFLPEIEIDKTTTPALSVETLIDILLEQLDDTVTLTQTTSQKQAILTKLLKDRPHLIVIDNLETVADYQTLLPLLRQLANPTKFILTSRHSLRAHADVFCCNLDELNQADALHLIRHEARARGQSLLANAADTALKRIYDVVGGNPLAIKLVVGQLSILSLPQVLDSLKEARSKKVEALFSYIYWQAWRLLDAAAQQTLLVMPLAQDGTLEQLLALSQLELDALSQALEQLAALSLVQVGGNLETRRYTIHRLTETFLLNEAIKWQASP